MSGHSHYATIKRQKEARDSQKGKVFSKHAKAIQIAIKTGGGSDPANNSRLRFAVDQAKADNVPKSNIERILARADEVGELVEGSYEGYGPEKVAVVVEVATDNKNRTAQEIKNIFERAGGNLASPGSVSYLFEKKGLLVVDKQGKNTDDLLLKLIDWGIEDIEEIDGEVEVYGDPRTLNGIIDQVKNLGFKTGPVKVIAKPKQTIVIDNLDKAKRILNFLDDLDDHDDVQAVATNLNFSPKIIKMLKL